MVTKSSKPLITVLSKAEADKAWIELVSSMSFGNI